MKDVKDILDEAQEKMDMAVMYLEESLAHIRAGKADVRLLDGIRVDSYGSMVPINNVAAVTTPDARSIAIKPWDKSMFRIIEKAIIDSDPVSYTHLTRHRKSEWRKDGPAGSGIHFMAGQLSDRLRCLYE